MRSHDAIAWLWPALWTSEARDDKAMFPIHKLQLGHNFLCNAGMHGLLIRDHAYCYD
jgi:hypothetical protein